MTWWKILSIGSMPLVQRFVSKGDSNTGSYVREKPETEEEQISTLWDQAFNHIPSQMDWLNAKVDWLNTKLTFILTFVALILGLLTFLGIAFIVGQ